MNLIKTSAYTRTRVRSIARSDPIVPYGYRVGSVQCGFRASVMAIPYARPPGTLEVTGFHLF
jgi:hypothetical protein